MSITNKTRQHVTDTIIAELKNGVRPWCKPFNGESMVMPLRGSTGTPYRGINIILLWLAQKSNPYWLTFNQIQKLGGKVIKGTKGNKVVWSGYTQPKDESKDEYWSCKLYNVHNASDTTGLPDKFYPKTDGFINPDEPIPWVDASILQVGADLNEGDIACYVPSQDKVFMPPWTDFRSALDYYSTIIHEIVHWTGHATRLDRLDIKNKKGYAFEELVAEMGAAFLMAHFNLEPTVREDHAQYIGHWIEALGSDIKYVSEAASVAQNAVDYIAQRIEAAQQSSELEMVS